MIRDKVIANGERKVRGVVNDKSVVNESKIESATSPTTKASSTIEEKVRDNVRRQR